MELKDNTWYEEYSPISDSEDCLHYFYIRKINNDNILYDFICVGQKEYNFISNIA